MKFKIERIFLWAVLVLTFGAVYGAEVKPAVKPLPKLLELGAESCIPCKMMQKVLAELRRDYPKTLKVDFIDVWKNPQTGKQYKILVIPTQIFFNAKGKEIFRHSGYYSEDEIVKKFRELGVKL